MASVQDLVYTLNDLERKKCSYEHDLKLVTDMIKHTKEKIYNTCPHTYIEFKPHYTYGENSHEYICQTCFLDVGYSLYAKQTNITNQSRKRIRDFEVNREYYRN